VPGHGSLGLIATTTTRGRVRDERTGLSRFFPPGSSFVKVPFSSIFSLKHAEKNLKNVFSLVFHPFKASLFIYWKNYFVVRVVKESPGINRENFL
jgi:hypothetical protein